MTAGEGAGLRPGFVEVLGLPRGMGSAGVTRWGGSAARNLRGPEFLPVPGYEAGGLVRTQAQVMV